jgi:hypothetical protein
MAPTGMIPAISVVFLAISVSSNAKLLPLTHAIVLLTIEPYHTGAGCRSQETVVQLANGVGMDIQLSVEQRIWFASRGRARWQSSLPAPGSPDEGASPEGSTSYPSFKLRRLLKKGGRNAIFAAGHHVADRRIVRVLSASAPSFTFGS